MMQFLCIVIRELLRFLNHSFIMQEKVFYAIVSAIVIIGGVGIGVAYDHQVAVSSSHMSNQQISGTYRLDLVEVMDANYNSSIGAQPRYYEVVNGSLQSTSNITLPTHTKITVTITSYDMGNASVPSQYLTVSGILNDKVLAINGTTAMGSNTSESWSTNMTSFPASKVLHTFTILQGSSTIVNIPVMAGYTEIASFYLNSTGSMTWQCEAACGTGSSGWGGAMSTAGWMTGTVYAQ
jgi:heme/copper-type cytochrome/quinol oxidase subunit 2